jgi:hypothetical protein
VPEYDSWSQVAGYFDGDGTISISDMTNMPYKLSLSLVFVDQSFDQIKTIREFLWRHGIPTSNILRTSKNSAYMVAVSQFDAVKEALGQMLPYLCKKEIEARAALDYYENRITGNQLALVFRQEVEAGRRERHARRIEIDVPFIRNVGDATMKELRKDKLRDAFGRYRAKVTAEDFQSIRQKYDRGETMKELMVEFPNYCRTTIQRILGRNKRGVLVKNVGMIHPTKVGET